MLEEQTSVLAVESMDGDGAADHDEPYAFGHLPHAAAPFPFSTRQYARLLAYRSRVRSGLAGRDDGTAW